MEATSKKPKRKAKASYYTGMAPRSGGWNEHQSIWTKADLPQLYEHQIRRLMFIDLEIEE